MADNPTSNHSSGDSSPVSGSAPSGPLTPATEKFALFDDQNQTANQKQYILVTGGLGFIGSHTSVELLKAGYNVIIVDDLSNAYLEVFDRVLQVADLYFASNGGDRPEANLHAISYRDMDAMRDLLNTYSSVTLEGEKRKSQIVGVIHFAAFKAVEESIRQPLKYYRNNINGLVDLMSLLEEHEIKTFIFSSSATVYGTIADRGLPVQEENCVHGKLEYTDKNGEQQSVEQGCTGLTNPYGRTKFFGEAILSDLAFSDPSWTIIALRYFNPIGCDSTGILGEDPKGIPSNLLPVVVKVMTKQYAELSVFGSDWNTPDGTAIRDFIHVTDLAQGHIAAMAIAQGQKLKENFRTFNLGTGTGYSVEEVASTMESVSKLPIPRKPVGRRAGDVGTCVAVADRATHELGWQTKKSLKDACQDICNYLEVHSI